jgi:hypothetical protein
MSIKNKEQGVFMALLPGFEFAAEPDQGEES